MITAISIYDKNQAAHGNAGSHLIAVVIPCYKVKRHVMDVIDGIGNEVWRIYVVDDACPEKSGKHVEAHCQDRRVRGIYHENNPGGGGAVKNGYRAATAVGAVVFVKRD